MARAKLTTEEINTRLADRGIKIIGEYTNQRTKTTFSCLSGHTWEATPHSIMHGGKGCGKCSGNQKLTQQEVADYLSQLDLTLISVYKSAKEPIRIRCSSGHEWSSRLDNIKAGKGCPDCANTWGAGGYLYIMGSTAGTKIGVSVSPKKRLQEVKRVSGFEDLALRYVFFFDRSTALDLEKESHRRFYDLRCSYSGFCGSTEFFNITPELARDFLIEEFGAEESSGC